ARTAALALPEVTPDAADLARKLQAAAEGLSLGVYRFDRYLGAAKKTPTVLESFRIALGAQAPEDAGAALARARETARAVADARNLVNEPAGFLTPRKLAEIAEKMASAAGLEVEIL